VKKKVVLVAVFLSLIGVAVGVYGEYVRQKCSTCNGTGYNGVCLMCKGAKVLSVFNGFYNMNFQCYMCNGTGKGTCGDCNGYGVVLISDGNETSGGSGRSSDGGGSYGGGGGYSGGDGSGMVSCSYCGGSGRCSRCNGNYVSNCSYCNGVGKRVYGYGLKQDYETCATCNGTGKNYCVCYTANHPGQCSICLGKGYK